MKVHTLLLCVLIVTSGTAYRDEDFEEFDDEETEFDFDVSDEIVEGSWSV